MNLAQEEIVEGKIQLEYIHNSKMRADRFSKLYDPKDHMHLFKKGS
jgi:hypothetical protein